MPTKFTQNKIDSAVMFKDLSAGAVFYPKNLTPDMLFMAVEIVNGTRLTPINLRTGQEADISPNQTVQVVRCNVHWEHAREY